eukprot:jgi/Pico_ML_1/53164/g3765.t1
MGGGDPNGLSQAKFSASACRILRVERLGVRPSTSIGEPGVFGRALLARTRIAGAFITFLRTSLPSHSILVPFGGAS